MPTYESPEHEEAAQRIADRHNRRQRPIETAPPDPHAIIFADGCRSWLGFSSRPQAEDALEDVTARNPGLFAGATVIPIRRQGQVVYDRRTGLELPLYAICPEHSTGAAVAGEVDR